MKLSYLLVLTCGALLTIGWSFQSTAAGSLQGDWTLVYLQLPAGDSITDFPDKPPVIRFDTSINRSSGTTGCNRFSGDYVAVNGQMRFDMEKMALTRMACVGDGEGIFLNALKGITHYSIKGQNLLMLSGKTVIMRWQKI